MIKLFLTWLCFTLLSVSSFATVNTANVLSLNTSSTNVTTAAYVVLSSSLPVTPSQLVIVNSTTSVLKLAVGASGSEVDFVSVPPSSAIVIEQLSKHLVTGNRLTVEAISATASSGYISVSLIP